MNNFEAKLYINVKDIIEIENLFHFKAYPFYLLFGTIDELKHFLMINNDKIVKHYMEFFYHKKLMPYYDILNTEARI